MNIKHTSSYHMLKLTFHLIGIGQIFFWGGNKTISGTCVCNLTNVPFATLPPQKKAHRLPCWNFLFEESPSYEKSPSTQLALPRRVPSVSSSVSAPLSIQTCIFKVQGMLRSNTNRDKVPGSGNSHDNPATDKTCRCCFLNGGYNEGAPLPL